MSLAACGGACDEAGPASVKVKVVEWRLDQNALAGESDEGRPRLWLWKQSGRGFSSPSAPGTADFDRSCQQRPKSTVTGAEGEEKVKPFGVVLMSAGGEAWG